MRLGRLDARHDSRTLQLAKYVGALPPAPSSCDWTSKVKSWPMFANDTVGDCTFAGLAHMIEAWTAADSKEATITTAQVLAGYEALTGYNPKDPSTDRGAVELDVLRYAQKTGLAGHRIGPYMSVAPANTALIKDAIYLFGGVYAGVALPISAQTQDVWDVPPGGARGTGRRGSWGGHCVPIMRYTDRLYGCITWGGIKLFTPAFLKTYFDEAYAILAPDWLSAGKAPNGFDGATLSRDLVML
jgi:hypothetical protein